MDKKMLLRAGIIIGIFISILGLAYGCSVQQANKVKTPSISNPDDVYATIGGYEITNQILWDEMKGTEGYAYLEQYIDDLTIADYIDLVTDQDVAEEIEYITYQTKDQEVIAEIQADAELNQGFIDVFNNRLLASGFDPLNADDRRTYVETGIAKFNFVKEYLLIAEGEDTLAVSETEVSSYYAQTVYEDACVINIRFNSADEAENVLNHFNLVPDFEGTMALYLPGDLTEAYVEDLTIDFISAETAEDGETVNVEELHYKDVFDYYIKMLNYMNPWEDQIDENIKMANYCNEYADRAVMNFDEMVEGGSVGESLFDLAIYTFTTLDLEKDEPVRFSDSVQAFGQENMLVFKVAQEESVSYTKLTDAEKLAVKETMIDNTISSSIISQVLDALRAEEDLVIVDPDMGLLRQIENSEEFDNGGSETIVAKYGDMKITADTLFNYMKEKAGMFYAVDIAKRRTLVYSDLYTDLYGSSHNYLKSNNELIKDYFKSLTLYKSQYNGGAYIANGVDPSEVSWSEFLYAAFGADNEPDVVERIFVYPTLIIPYINSSLVNFESALPYITEQYDNYFSIETSHLLIYVDFDNDFVPDDYSDYIAAFTPEELDAYVAIKIEFENILDTKLDEVDMTFEKIVAEFNDSLLSDDDNVWKNIQAYGFRIETESSLTVNYNTADALDLEFLSDVMELIESYNMTANEAAEYLYHPSLTTSDFGIHKIKGEKGTAFVTPSAKFEETDADAPEFSVGSENANDLPTKEQYMLYAQIKYAELIGEETELSIPESVALAIDTLTYLRDSEANNIIDKTYYVNSSTMASAGLNIALLESLLSNNEVQFAADNAAILVKLEGILASTYFSTFPESYIKVSDLN